MRGRQQGAGPARVTRQQPSGECAGCARARAGWRAGTERARERGSERARRATTSSRSHGALTQAGDAQGHSEPSTHLGSQAGPRVPTQSAPRQPMKGLCSLSRDRRRCVWHCKHTTHTHTHACVKRHSVEKITHFGTPGSRHRQCHGAPPQHIHTRNTCSQGCPGHSLPC